MGNLLNLMTPQAVDVSELLAEAQAVTRSGRAQGAMLILDKDGEAHIGIAGTYLNNPIHAIQPAKDAVTALQKREKEQRAVVTRKVMTPDGELLLSECSFPSSCRTLVDPRAVRLYEQQGEIKVAKNVFSIR